MASVNKVILLGNLGADPEVRYTATGNAMANIRLATNEVWNDKQTGERQERTEWHRIVFFGRQAEIVGQYLRKGSQIYLEGSLQTRKWQGQDGVERYTTEIVGREFKMLDRRGDQEGSYSGGQEAGEHYQSSGGGGAARPASAPSQAPTAGNSPPLNDFDDDIPF